MCKTCICWTGHPDHGYINNWCIFCCTLNWPESGFIKQKLYKQVSKLHCIHSWEKKKIIYIYNITYIYYLLHYIYYIIYYYYYYIISVILLLYIGVLLSYIHNIYIRQQNTVTLKTLTDSLSSPSVWAKQCRQLPEERNSACQHKDALLAVGHPPFGWQRNTELRLQATGSSKLGQLWEGTVYSLCFTAHEYSSWWLCLTANVTSLLLSSW